jgi:hypothetical protein
MRFMVILKADKNTEADVPPDEKILTEMYKYNQELIKAGVLMDAAGLHSSSKGARVKFSGGKRIVTDGPFAETKELVAGYWMFQVGSKQEAIDWVKKCPEPLEGDAEIEIREVIEIGDLPDVPPEIQEQEDRINAARLGSTESRR